MLPTRLLSQQSLPFLASLSLVLSPALSNLEPGGFFLRHSVDYSHLFIPRLLTIVSFFLFLPSLIRSRLFPGFLVVFSGLLFSTILGTNISTVYIILKIFLVFYSSFLLDFKSLLRVFSVALLISLILGLLIYVLDGCNFFSCPRFYFFSSTNNFLPFRLAGSFAEPAPFAALLLLVTGLYVQEPAFSIRKIVFLTLMLIISGSTLIVLLLLCFLFLKSFLFVRHLRFSRLLLICSLPLALFFILYPSRYFRSVSARLDLLPDLSLLRSIIDSFHLFGSTSIDFDSVIPGFLLIGTRLGFIPLFIILGVILFAIFRLLRNPSVNASPFLLALIAWALYSEAPFDPILIFPIALSFRIHRLQPQLFQSV